MAAGKKQKLYAYVDEAGQDSTSDFFVVVALVSDKEQDVLRKKLLAIEEQAKTGKKKWHKSRSERRIHYLTSVLDQHIAKGEVFFGHYKKPIPYFFPIVEVLEKAIVEQAKGKYKTIIYIDGIDRKKAAELTNVLRARGISLGFVKSRRDESEPLIRLADMWAGCIRGALLKNADSTPLLKRATREAYLRDVRK